MRASPGLLLFVVMLAVVVPAGHAGGQGPVEIWIKPTTTWSVTGDDDIAHLKHLAAGVGGEFAPNMEILERLQCIGIRYSRPGFPKCEMSSSLLDAAHTRELIHTRPVVGDRAGINRRQNVLVGLLRVRGAGQGRRGYCHHHE